MADARGPCSALLKLFASRPRPRVPSRTLPQLRRTAASHAVAAQDIEELEDGSSLSPASAPPSPANKRPFDPLATAKRRKKQLPASRYRFRPPRYYRGPLHPHQPPPSSDPASREFVPGPFTFPRLQQTYQSTIAPDIMTLTYQHFPPGFKPPPKAERLRSWDGSSPYHKGRPLRAPRGGDTLTLLRKRITFRNIPEPTGVTVHTFVKEVVKTKTSGPLHVAGMAIQAITGVRCKAHAARRTENKWGLKKGNFVALTGELAGEDMYNFLAKLVDIVLPRIRDWRGVKGTSGDDNGNISFGLTPEQVALFPEIAVNYDSYPPHLIPGANITIRTSAKTDKDARVLLTALGIPFYGKFVD